MTNWDWREAFDDAETHPTHKLRYAIWAMMDPTADGLSVVNTLDHASDEDAARSVPGTGDVILSGLQGEQWPSKRANAQASYKVVGPDGSVLGAATPENVMAGRAEGSPWAMVVAEPGPEMVAMVVPDGVGDFTMEVWGQTVHGKAGDVVLVGTTPEGEPDFCDHRLVAADVARMTYDLSAFGIEPVQAPVPKMPDRVRAHLD